VHRSFNRFVQRSLYVSGSLENWPPNHRTGM
jgi:hypothetical protein